MEKLNLSFLQHFQSKNYKTLYTATFFKPNRSPEEIKSTILQYFYKQKTLTILS